MATQQLCRTKPTKKYIKKKEKENKTMNMSFEIEGKLDKITLPDDYRVFELFADLENIPETTAVNDIVNLMKNTKKGLVVDGTGEKIYFKDYANDSTTLASLGVSPDKIYRVSKDVKRVYKSG